MEVRPLRSLALCSLVVCGCKQVGPVPDPISAGVRQMIDESPGRGDGTLVVLNKAEATASLIDLGSGEVAATVPTGEGPHEVAVSPDGTLAVATNYGTRAAPGSSLTVIALAREPVVRTLQLGEFQRPHGVEFIDADSVVVTVEEQKSVLCVNIETGEMECAVETGEDVSHMVSVTDDGSRAFVANIGSGTVSVLDLEKQELVRTIPTAAGAEGIEVVAGGRQVWVTNREADSVTVLDVDSLEVLAVLESQSFPIRAAATPAGDYVLVTNARSGTVNVFSTEKLSLVREVEIPLSAEDSSGRLFGDKFGDSSVPIGILIHPDGTRAFVAHANADVITVLDLQTWEPRSTLRAGKEPDGLAYSPVDVTAELYWEKHPEPDYAGPHG